MATKKSLSEKVAANSLYGSATLVDIRTFLNVYKNSPLICEKFASEGCVGYQLTAEELGLMLKGDEPYHNEDCVLGMTLLCDKLSAEGAGDTVVMTVIPVAKTPHLCTSFSFGIKLVEGVIGVYDAARNPLTAIEITESVIGLGSHAIGEIDGLKVIIPIRLSEDLSNDVYTKNAQSNNEGFEPQRFSGLPPKEVPSFIVAGEMVKTLDEPKPRVLSPKSVPFNTPIEILDMCEPDEKYGTAKIIVSVDGDKPSEMLVSAPIKNAITGGGRLIDESDIGKKFEILGVVEYRPGGKAVPVSAEDDRPQTTVLARRVYQTPVAA
jgi:hypothetical protein